MRSPLFPPNPIFLGSALDEDAAQWIATVGPANVSQPRGVLVSDTIRSLKAANVWAYLDFFAVYAAENETQALTDWKARKAGVAINSPTFTPDRGYVFDGATNYLTTLFAPSADCVAATGTSFMLGVYERTDVNTGAARAMGSYNTTSRSALIVPRNGSSMAANLCATAVSVVTGLTTSAGLSVAATNGTVGSGYKNGVAGATPTLTSPGSTLPTYPIFIGCYNSVGSPTSYRAASISLALFGRNMDTTTQYSQLYDVVQRLMTRLGANV